MNERMSTTLLRRMRRWTFVGAAALAIGGAAAAAVVLTRGGDGSKTHAARAAEARRPTLADRFAVLSRAHSNRCGMPASALDSMPSGSRLQGACCFPMDYRSYVNQVRELNRRYAEVAVIPKDPYDISVTLAKRLIGYQSIKLSPAQQRTYERAKPLSATKGPCCCPCWRWTAFGGQAKYLITRRQYSARQIADVWSAEEGCGGPSHRNA
jgi:hypothetical protein